MKKVAAGEPLRIPAQWFNLVTDAARKFQHGNNLGSAPPRQVWAPEGLVFISNDSGHDRKRFEVLGLDDILIDPADNLLQFQNQPAFSGVTPTSDHIGYFGILAEPIRNGAIGRCFVFGVCACGIRVSNENDEFADVKPGDATQLQSGGSGCSQILWKEPGTGSVNALIRFGNSTSTWLFAKLTSQDATNKWWFNWSEAQPTSGGWALKSGGRSGSTTGGSADPAMFVNSSITFDLSSVSSPYVLLVRANPDSSGQSGWVIVSPIGLTGSGSHLTNVFFDGTDLKYSSIGVHYANGLLLNTTSEDDTTIDTPDQDCA